MPWWSIWKKLLELLQASWSWCLLLCASIIELQVFTSPTSNKYFFPKWKWGQQILQSLVFHKAWGMQQPFYWKDWWRVSRSAVVVLQLLNAASNVENKSFSSKSLWVAYSAFDGRGEDLWVGRQDFDTEKMLGGVIGLNLPSLVFSKLAFSGQWFLQI